MCPLLHVRDTWKTSPFPSLQFSRSGELYVERELGGHFIVFTTFCGIIAAASQRAQTSTKIPQWADKLAWDLAAPHRHVTLPYPTTHKAAATRK